MREPPGGVEGVPDESGTPPVELKGHGNLHVGRGTSEDGEVLERPYIWIWIEPADDHPCNEYRFYQFFKPELYILEPDDLNPDGTRSEDAEPETGLPELTPKTGVSFKFDHWNPDFHKKPADDEDHQRRRDGRPRLPRYRPGHLTPPAGGPKPGRPFIQYRVPGTNPNGTTPLPGLCDGPSFNERADPDTLSPVEFLFLEKTRPRHATGARPPSGRAIVEVVVQFETCLACVDGGEFECLQCLHWSYTERSTLRTEWTEDHSSSDTPSLGAPTDDDDEPRWKLGTAVIERAATIDVKGWSPCR